MNPYVYQAERRIWQRRDAQPLAYSDGEEAETRLLQTLRQARDVSTLSPELSAAPRDWPGLYHLSPLRHNLLRFLTFAPTHSILELGCGCGAITRLLGESGARVVAVEGSPRRAEIAAERCRDLPNVHIHCDNLADFETHEKFDYVTLIGVLEYAPMFVTAEDPVHAVLAKARSMLGGTGVLILAIENQLGLMYFNGLAEDHTGKPYFGIHGLYEKGGPVTFGRGMLAAKLALADFAHQRFFYPFPDYKLPRVILTEAAPTAPDFEAAGLLAGLASSDQAGGSAPDFFEPLVWPVIAANGLLPDLANSFLILAAGSPNALERLDRSALAYAYATERLPRYAIETVFRRHEDGSLGVEKRLCFYTNKEEPAPAFAGGYLRHHPAGLAEYSPGRPYIAELQLLLARGADLPAVVQWAASWFDLLLANTEVIDGRVWLSGDWLDAIPQNFIRVTDGALRRIDEEWSSSAPLPLAWIIIRGLAAAIAGAPTSPALAKLSLGEVIRQVAAARAIALSDDDFQLAIRLEAELRGIVFGDPAFAERYADFLDQPARSLIVNPMRHEQQQGRIALLEQEIARIKATVSWRITRPLRLLANLPRDLRRILVRNEDGR